MADNEFWDSQEELGQVSKNDKGDIIKVSKVSKKGKSYIDIRTYYLDKTDSLSPGKGIAIPIDLVDEIAGLMMK